MSTRAQRDRILRHLHTLSVAFGARPAGSPANAAAADYIAEVFLACGLEVERQTFPCTAWQELETRLSLGGRALEAAANPFSPAYAGAAATVTAGTLAELAAAELTGRIVVLHGDLTRAPLAPKAWMFKGAQDERIIALLEAGAPAAVIAVRSAHGRLDRLIEDGDLAIPSVTVPPASGLALLRQPGAVVELRIEVEARAGATANIVGRRSGAQPTSIVFCAHYDTKVDTPGASDNGGGVAVLLVLAERLSVAELSCGLQFVAFTNEEYLPLGDDEYVHRLGGAFDSIAAALNFDGVGQTLSVTSLAPFNLAPEFQRALETITAGYPGVVWTEPWPESNHSTFAFRGVPCLAFTARGGELHYHLRTDTPAWMSEERLSEVVDLASAIATLVADRPPGWTRSPAAAVQP